MPGEINNIPRPSEITELSEPIESLKYFNLEAEIASLHQLLDEMIEESLWDLEEAKAAAFVERLISELEAKATHEPLKGELIYQLKKPTKIPFQTFARRFQRYMEFTVEEMIHAFLLMDRYFKLTKTGPHILTIHSLFLAAACCAVKMLRELRIPTMQNLADCGGVKLQQMNQLELAFFKDLHFNAYIKAEEFQACYKGKMTLFEPPVEEQQNTPEPTKSGTCFLM